jgi:hypothetical protein
MESNEIIYAKDVYELYEYFYHFQEALAGSSPKAKAHQRGIG